jgi:high affinity Mn2+ porin
MRRCVVVLLGLGTLSFGQQPTLPLTSSEGGGSLAERLWLSGQANIVNQSHPGFDAKYSGPNSFHDYAEQKTTWVITLYTGFSLAKNTEIFFDVEGSHGAGVSGALGLGGLPNFDAVTDTSDAPYIARAQVRQIIRLGREMEEAVRNPLGLASRVPSKRLEMRIGKMGVTDFFDLNSVGNDSHLQFLNYAIDNNAAYDYAANSRGYTYGALFELYHPGWVARFG